MRLSSSRPSQAELHPVATSPPSLLVTVCGIVMHRKDAVKSAHTTSKALDDQPRIFSQTFILTPDTEAAAEPGKSAVKYYVNTDDMRFVG